MFSLMLFQFCFFLGIFAMLLFLIKKIDSQFRNLGEENARLRVLLRALESRLANIDLEGGAERACDDGLTNASAPQPEQDPLLHLSFGSPHALPDDPSLDPER